MSDREVCNHNIERTADCYQCELEARAHAQRSMDLVRYSRHFLQEEGLISDKEYAALVADSEGTNRVARLETYDALRKENAALVKALEEVLTVARKHVYSDVFATAETLFNKAKSTQEKESC
jgi:hypothetical protein